MRALVLGAGIAGLAAAAALQPHAEVTLLERDVIPDQWVPRAGVPQSRQLHNLLGRAQQDLEFLAPGFLSALESSGATSADLGRETHVHEFGCPMPRRTTGVRIMSAPRPQIEGVLRSIVQPTIRQATPLGIEVHSDQAIGVRTEEHGFIGADIVVDAMGARSPGRNWLPTPPRQDRRIVGQWYATGLLARPARSVGDPTFWLIFPDVDGTRGGLLSPFGEDRWVISVSGFADDVPPRDRASLLDYAASLDDPGLADVVSTASLEAPLTLFRRPEVVWNRYDELQGQPSGYFALGDSVACLNPLLGQGMSVAAWQARLVRECVATSGSLKGVSRRLAEPVEAALGLSSLLHQSIRNTRGEERDTGQHLRKLAALVSVDADLHRTWVRMWHLLTPAEDLLTPAMVDLTDRESREGEQ